MNRPLAGGYPHILNNRESEKTFESPAYFLGRSLTDSTPCEKLRDLVMDRPGVELSPRHSLPPPPTTVLGLPLLAIH